MTISPPTRIAVQDKIIGKSKRKVTAWALCCRYLFSLQCYKTLLSDSDEKPQTE